MRKRVGVGVRGVVLQGVREWEGCWQSVLVEMGQVGKEEQGLESHLVDGGGEGVRRSV